MKDINPLSTGLCDLIDKYTKDIRSRLLVAQPFNDFDADENRALLNSVKSRCKAMIELVEAHQKIHDQWLEQKNFERITELMGQGLINPGTTPDE